MDFKTRKRYYNRCAPNDALEPDDERNVDLDSLCIKKGSQVRGDNWTEVLMNDIILTDTPSFKMFTGLPGSGKTTELKRLAQRMSDVGESDSLFPVYIDALELIDISSPIDATDILTSIVYATEYALLKAKGENPESAMEDGHFKRFWNWLTKTDVELTQLSASPLPMTKLILELKEQPSFRQKVRNAVIQRFSEFLKKVQAEMARLNEEVKQVTNKNGGLVVIFDSLEKLRGLSSNWNEVLDSAERVFGGGAPHLHLPVHTIYTVPAALVSRITGVHFFPMIKVKDKKGKTFQPGIDAARELIRRRIPDDILNVMFGENAEKCVKDLILRTGGYPRQILTILQGALAKNEFPVSNEVFEKLLANIANQYRLLVPGEAFDWLAEVECENFLTIQDDDHGRKAALMLQSNVVLCYSNNEIWYELHPAVKNIPGVQEAIRVRKQNGDSYSGGINK